MLIKTLLLLFLFFPLASLAYVGPGSGLSAIGSFIALIAAIFFGVVGFLWFPIKRLLKRNKQPSLDGVAKQVESESESENEN